MFKDKNLKGQFTIEFIISVVIFLGLIIYALTFITQLMPVFQSEHENNYLKSKAYQISEMLIFDDGMWDGEKFVRVGLASDYYVLNYTKMQRLHGSCESNYEDLLTSLGLKKNRVVSGIVIPMNYYMKIEISNSTATSVDCGPDVAYDVTTVQVIRYAVDENADITKVIVRLW